MVLGIDGVEGLIGIPKASKKSIYDKGGGYSIIFIEWFQLRINLLDFLSIIYNIFIAFKR